MAKLKLYNSIEDKDTKTIMEGWFGIFIFNAVV